MKRIYLRPLHAYLQSVVLVGEKNEVSHGASSRDGQATQGTTSQQLQPTQPFQQSCLSSGKFKRNSFLKDSVTLSSLVVLGPIRSELDRSRVLASGYVLNLMFA